MAGLARRATTPRRQAALTRGQGLVEYGLMLTLIAIVSITSLVFLGGTVTEMLSAVGMSV